jgi:hypothetical protein
MPWFTILHSFSSNKTHGIVEITDALFSWMDHNQILQNIWYLPLKKINNKGISQV